MENQEHYTTQMRRIRKTHKNVRGQRSHESKLRKIFFRMLQQVKTLFFLGFGRRTTASKTKLSSKHSVRHT